MVMTGMGFLTPWPDPRLSGGRRRWREKTGRDSCVGRVLLFLPLTQRNFRGHKICGIVSALGQGQGTSIPIHAGKSCVGHMDPQK